jgi:hypothetical protein
MRTFPLHQIQKRAVLPGRPFSLALVVWNSLDAIDYVNIYCDIAILH